MSAGYNMYKNFRNSELTSMASYNSLDRRIIINSEWDKFNNITKMHWNNRAHMEYRVRHQNFKHVVESPKHDIVVPNICPIDEVAPDGTHERFICIICKCNLRNGIIKPCKHQCTCVECGKNLEKIHQPCPICRKAIESIEYYFQS
jgi:hypothetical protein